MYAINARSEHLNESWELVKFIRNEEADMHWVTKDLGGMPTTLKALHSPEAEKRRDLPMYRNELKYARPWPPHPAIINIAKNVMTPWTQKAIVGEVSPQAAVDEAAKEAQLILEGKK